MRVYYYALVRNEDSLESRLSDDLKRSDTVGNKGSRSVVLNGVIIFHKKNKRVQSLKAILI